MQILAGERAVTIRLSYPEAYGLTTERPKDKCGPILAELHYVLAPALRTAAAKGRPLPPLPK